MKHFILLFVFISIISLGNISFAQGTDKTKSLPYKADYSSNFKMGNDAYSKKVLELWKDWDDNKFDRHDYMADTVVMSFADGSELKGKKAAMEGAIKFRGSMSSAKSSVHAWLPLKMTDKNEDIVCIWGMEEDSFPDGKTQKKEIHEVWWFNKDGKVSMMRQWVAGAPEMK